MKNTQGPCLPHCYKDEKLIFLLKKFIFLLKIFIFFTFERSQDSVQSFFSEIALDKRQ